MVATDDSVIPATYDVAPMNGITEVQTTKLKHTLEGDTLW